MIRKNQSEAHILSDESVAKKDKDVIGLTDHSITDHVQSPVDSLFSFHVSKFNL